MEIRSLTVPQLSAIARDQVSSSSSMNSSWSSPSAPTAVSFSRRWRFLSPPSQAGFLLSVNQWRFFYALHPQLPVLAPEGAGFLAVALAVKDMIGADEP